MYATYLLVCLGTGISLGNQLTHIRKLQSGPWLGDVFISESWKEENPQLLRFKNVRGLQGHFLYKTVFVKRRNRNGSTPNQWYTQAMMPVVDSSWVAGEPVGYYIIREGELCTYRPGEGFLGMEKKRLAEQLDGKWLEVVEDDDFSNYIQNYADSLDVRPDFRLLQALERVGIMEEKIEDYQTHVPYLIISGIWILFSIFGLANTIKEGDEWVGLG
jgi:hypothetical protein